MSKNTLNIFNLSIYKQLCYDFERSLNGLIKYNKIYEKMDGYYTNEEIHYIIEVYINQMTDIINSNTFSLFVPENVRKEIKKFIPGIKANFNKKYYSRVISTFEKIKNIFYIEVEYENKV